MAERKFDRRIFPTKELELSEDFIFHTEEKKDCYFKFLMDNDKVNKLSGEDRNYFIKELRIKKIK